VPQGDDLEVIIFGANDTITLGVSYNQTLTNMPVLIGPEGLGIWSEEAIQKIASGLAKVAEFVVEQGELNITWTHSPPQNVVCFPLKGALNVFVGGVLEAQSGKAEVASSSWDKTITILASEKFSLRFKDIKRGDSFAGAFQVQGGKKIDFFIQGSWTNADPIARAYMKSEYVFNVIVSAYGSYTYLVVFDNSHNEEDVVVNYRLKIVTEGD
jgi:hypothetical protein